MRTAWCTIVAFTVVSIGALHSTAALPRPNGEHPYIASFERFHASTPTSLPSPEGGVLLLSELNCVACHAVPTGWSLTVPERKKISLANVGDRLSVDDLTAFIHDPNGIKPGTTMPSFGMAQAEARAIAQLLDKPRNASETRVFPRGDSTRGRDIYHTIGCVACHAPDADHPTPAGGSVPIALAERYSNGGLAAFLKDPLSSRPAGRMPAFPLSDQEAADLASYLKSGGVRGSSSDLESSAREIATAAPATMRCAACHDGIKSADAPDGPSLVSLRLERGCLSPTPPVGLPRYHLSPIQQAALVQAVEMVRLHPSGPILDASRALDGLLSQLNCYACHSFRGKGGLSDDRARFLTTLDPAAESLGEFGRLPPKIDFVGRKLNREWLHQLLTGDGGGIRPHLSVRMPGTDREVAERLILLLEEVCERVPPITMDTSGILQHQRAAAGRILLGTGDGGLGCIACHGLKGRKATGVSVIDLTNAVQRLRPSYFKELLLNPQAVQPGTLMPPLLAGRANAEKEVEAIWTYLKEIDQNRAPEGMVREGEYELKPTDTGKPIVFRTFLEGGGMHAIAIGYPEGVNAAFDSLEIRWTLVWRGRFLSAESTWEERMMTPAKPLGSAIESLPRRFPLARGVRTVESWPIQAGPAAGYRFGGVRIENDGVPTLLYQIEEVEVEDTMRATPDGKALKRRVVIRGQSGDWHFWGLSPNSVPERVQFTAGMAIVEENIPLL